MKPISLVAPILLSGAFVVAGCSGAAPASGQSDAAPPPQGTTADPAADGSDPSDAEIRKAIAAFLAQPTKESAAPILGFVEKSPRVLVVFRQTLVPAGDDTAALLMAAFAAGNAQAQLDSGKKGDEPLAGVKTMLEVYQKISPNGGTALADELLKYQKEGTLESEVAKRVAVP